MDLTLILGFEWDNGNARKNEKHGVTQAEVEQIFFRQPLIIAADVKHSSTEPRYHALGRTDEDRWLHVTFTYRDGGTLIRPISARTMHRKERPFMKKRLKPIPEFATESEERTFWESRKNDSTQYIDWSAAKVVSFPNLRPSTKTISLRLPEALLDTIRSRAHKLDIPYQSLMKLWLAEKATETTTDVRKSR